MSGLALNKTVNLKKSCAKYRDGTLVTHSFRMDFCSLAASNKKLCIMKRVLSILFLFLVLGSSVKAQLGFGFKEIVFTQKSDDRDMSGQSSSTSPEDAPKTRSVVLQPVYAYLDNGEITVYFVFSTVAISVINETTGKTVCSKTLFNPTNFSIDLNGEDSGEYIIEVISDGTSLEGTFSL